MRTLTTGDLSERQLVKLNVYCLSTVYHLQRVQSTTAGQPQIG